VKNISVFSYGGGVQSTAALVLAAQGKIAYSIFLFCNVGQDAENPDTLRYVNEVARPYAHAHGLTFLELQKRRRNGELDSLYGRLTRPGSSSIGIPVRLESGVRRSVPVRWISKSVWWLPGQNSTGRRQSIRRRSAEGSAWMSGGACAQTAGLPMSA
jgi:hypothetical protein